MIDRPYILLNDSKRLVLEVIELLAEREYVKDKVARQLALEGITSYVEFYSLSGN